MKKTKKRLKIVVKRIKNKINSIEYIKNNRVSEKDFTRNRKLPFKSLILFMLNIIKQTLQKELTHFISLFGKNNKNITKSAFCQSRMKLKHTAFIDLNDVILEEFYTDNDFKKWNDMIVLGVDGSKLNLPYSSEIIKDFGVKSKGGIMPQAIISSCYDLLNEIIIDTKIEKADGNERIMALSHIEKVKKIDNQCLMVFDRGYSAIWFMLCLLKNDIEFAMRLKIDFPQVRPFIESEEVSCIFDFDNCPRKSVLQLKNRGIEFIPIKIRFVRVILDDGTIEVIATSLLDEKKYPSGLFKELYSYRWGIETNFDRLKNKIEVENFTGFSTLSILQDYYANMFILNLQSLIAMDVQEEIDKEKKGAEHRYKVNKNLSLGFMKDKVVNILMGDNPRYLEELKDLFRIEPIPIRKGRKFPRNMNLSHRKYNINNKKAV